MSTEQQNNKAIVAHFNKAFIEGGDMDVYERTMHPEFVNHTPNPGQSAGPDGAAFFFNEILRPAFPDLVGAEALRRPPLHERTRTKTALNAFDITFDGRLTAARQ
ncbi:ester cyclase [Streptomyces sp. NPDC033538]|uniref:ester cyclase n=1 Tax=Streptomyces sp. NPDC033538 TaxID=3155367 RepID=UPI0033C583AF